MLDWLLSTFAKTLNYTLSYQLIDQNEYAELYGKKLLWHLEEPKIDCVTIIHPDRIIIKQEHDPKDVHLSITTDIWTLISLARGVKDKNQQFTLQGAHHLANLLKSYIRHISIDWEAMLSDIIGESAAHLMITQLKRSDRWVRRSKKSAFQSGQTYLQETSNITPSKHALRNFYDQVCDLSQDIERLERKVATSFPTSTTS